MKGRPQRAARSRARRDGFDAGPYAAAVMRHELYGALNSVSIIAGLLSERARRTSVPGEELAELATRLGRQIERATAIVDHYVEFVTPRGAAGGGNGGAAAELSEVERALDSVAP